jgi:hypothetical protein
MCKDDFPLNFQLKWNDIFGCYGIMHASITSREWIWIRPSRWTAPPITSQPQKQLPFTIAIHESKGIIGNGIHFVICMKDTLHQLYMECPVVKSNAYSAMPIQQGIANSVAVPIDKMLYIYLVCPHSKHPKNPFQSKQSKHFHPKNWFP